MSAWWSAQSRDDRGKAVEVLSHADAGHWVVSGDARIEGMMYRAANPRSARGGWDWIGLVTIVAAVIVLMIVLKVLFPGGPGWLFPLTYVAATIGTAWVLARVWTARNGELLAAAVLEEGLCPSCGYNLHGLAKAVDECVQCPECGAAWNAKRIARSAPIAPGAVFGDPAITVGKSATRMVTDSFDTTDSRGGAARVMDNSRLRDAAKRCCDEGEKARLNGLRRKVLKKTAGVRWGVVATIWAFAGVAWYAGWPPVFAVAPLGFSIGFMLGNFGISMTRVRDMLLAEGACPACAGDLHGVPADADWVTECPRCRAAWRVTSSSSAASARSRSAT